MRAGIIPSKFVTVKMFRLLVMTREGHCKDEDTLSKEYRRDTCGEAERVRKRDCPFLKILSLPEASLC
jgi:hypothetical protein